ncbi:MAG: hypothetical protein F6K58_05845 [Symploca sp. SIO2E9]|nr:hypothetical protein [Symploca sp. SIO2E9]
MLRPFVYGKTLLALVQFLGKSQQIKIQESQNIQVSSTDKKETKGVSTMTQDNLGIVIRQYYTLKEQGFPEGHIDAFYQVAKQEECVIMTRTPGKVCEQLLAEGYDGKGFHIKAKSCNWGPMAGFVCLDPFLNKNGKEGVLSNLEANYKSLTQEFEGKTAGIQHIQISDFQFNWLRRSDYVNEGTYINGQTFIDDVTQNQNNKDKITFAYALVKEENGLWGLYYDIEKNYGVKFDPPDTIEERLASACAEKLTEIIKNTPNPPTQEELEKKFRDPIFKTVEFRCIKDINNNNKCYAKVYGMVNAHPPYPQEYAYKNAVTGDYDLFAVWPKNFDEGIITNKGTPAGNISNEVYRIGQIINSKIAELTPGIIKPNRVFHGDEVGRPGVESLELPVVAFVPLGSLPEGEIFLIKENKQMEDFTKKCQEQFLLILNPGWQEELNLDPDKGLILYVM